jgi:hypothetical protein
MRTSLKSAIPWFCAGVTVVSCTAFLCGGRTPKPHTNPLDQYTIHWCNLAHTTPPTFILTRTLRNDVSCHTFQEKDLQP